jgi:cytochrome c553/cytochrome c5
MKFLLKIGAFFAARGAWRLFARGRSSLPPERSPADEALSPATYGPSTTKRLLFELTALLGAFAAGGFLLALSGLVSIKASSGHWAITKSFLEFSKQRSVSTYALFLQAPSLDEPGLVLKGAGQYEIGCRPCHGAPELRSPRVASKMTPHPPHLPETISRWTPEELFYIVKHGIKFTGMPAWPTQQRDDEVWAIVAFLMKFSDMHAQEYRRLARGELPVQGEPPPIQELLGSEWSPKAVHESCGRCHGIDGRGRGPGSFPVLAGQTPSYLFNALQAFADGERHSGIMEPIAAGMRSDSMRELATYYSRLSGLRSVSAQRHIAPALKRGESIAQRGLPSQRVPACGDCHGPSSTPRNAAYPVLSGQYADYLVLQLTLFKEQRRGGSAYAHLMYEVAPRLTAEQMHDVASYYESLGSGFHRQPASGPGP